MLQFFDFIQSFLSVWWNGISHWFKIFLDAFMAIHKAITYMVEVVAFVPPQLWIFTTALLVIAIIKLVIGSNFKVI